MTDAEFIALALSLPEAALSSHFDKADLRVRGKIFAGPAEGRDGAALLKLTPAQQEMMCEAEPKLFRPVPGGWGAKGWTLLTLAAADDATARGALWTAWRNTAPAALAKLHPTG
jgi:hypothetical protein